MRQPIFSKEGYIEVLRNAKEKGYNFILFKDKDDVNDLMKYCLIRHDIDTSLKCALEMAEIENNLDIRSTFFFMLRSPAYNLFSRHAAEVLGKISKMGHEIALHFDAGHPAVCQDNLHQEVNFELNVLSTLSGQSIRSVSFHQPSKIILQGDTLLSGVVNTYNKEQMKGWYYTSDSNRIWKEHNAFSVFEDQHLKIQMLIHPIWWIYDNEVIEDAWDSALMDNFYIMQLQFLETEAAYGGRRTIKIDRQ